MMAGFDDGGLPFDLVGFWRSELSEPRGCWRAGPGLVIPSTAALVP